MAAVTAPDDDIAPGNPGRYGQLGGPSPANLQGPPTPAVPSTSDAATNSAASSLTIEELTAPTGKQPRKIVLQGPSLPFMGAEWGGENALVTTWYPGNGDEASQQSLGPKEVPSAWSGEWNRTLMGKAPTTYVTDAGSALTLVDPDSLVNALEDILRAGMRLRVTWSAPGSGSTTGKKVREGRAKSWKFKYTRMTDVAWDVNFEWQSRGKRVQTATSVRDGGIDAASAALNTQMANVASAFNAADLVASNADILNSASPDTLGQYESIADGPMGLALDLSLSAGAVQVQLGQVATIAASLPNQPQQVAQAAINVAKNGAATMNEAVDTFGQQPPETWLKAGSQSVTAMLRAFRFFGAMSDFAIQAANAASDMARSLQQKGSAPGGSGGIGVQAASSGVRDILAVYGTKDADTPQRISQRFYGNPDHAQDIMQANRLPWMQPSFPKGTILLIPALRTQQRGA